jgi:hypothetical protein
MLYEVLCLFYYINLYYLIFRLGCAEESVCSSSLCYYVTRAHDPPARTDREGAEGIGGIGGVGGISEQGEVCVWCT